MSNLFFRFNASVLPYITVFFTFVYLFLFYRHSILWVGGIVILAWLAAFLLKIIFRKVRPEGCKVSTLFPAEAKYSFPSEHSAIFASLGVCVYSLNHNVGAVLLFIALLIGMSRAMCKVHFWQDIIFGWLLGIIIGLFFI